MAHLGSIQPLETATTVGVFLADDGEPDTGAWFGPARARGTRLALPVPAPQGNRMEFRPWSAADRLEEGRFGIPAPPGQDPVVPTVFLVPLVCFDSAGNRVGRGAGFYDRYLTENGSGPATGSLTIGIAFEAQRAPRIPAAPHDVALDMIVTELGIRFNRPMDQR